LGRHTLTSDTIVSSTDYTATGGIDRQTLGNGVVNDFTYDEVSNRLDRIFIPVYTGTKPGYLALVDLAYEYDPDGNISRVGWVEEAQPARYAGAALAPRPNGPCHP